MAIQRTGRRISHGWLNSSRGTTSIGIQIKIGLVEPVEQDQTLDTQARSGFGEVSNLLQRLLGTVSVLLFSVSTTVTTTTG